MVVPGQGAHRRARGQEYQRRSLVTPACMVPLGKEDVAEQVGQKLVGYHPPEFTQPMHGNLPIVDREFTLGKHARLWLKGQLETFPVGSSGHFASKRIAPCIAV